MEILIESAHELMVSGARLIIIGFETFGIFMMLVVGIQGVYNLCNKDPETGLKLSEGLGLALQFLMGGEILRTIIVSEMSEIFHVGGIVVLRVALTLLTHWELKNQREELKNDEMISDREEKLAAKAAGESAAHNSDVEEEPSLKDTLHQVLNRHSE